MRKILLPILALLAMTLAMQAKPVSSITTPSGKKMSATTILGAGSAGNEFIIAIPANDDYNASMDYISIYLTSPFNTIVKFKDNMSSGAGKPINVKAYKITTLARSIVDEISSTSEFEKAINRTFTLTSSKRFCVYVINRKPASTDGYMAIPTSGWGTRYIHLCNYDNPEDYNSCPLGYNQGSGFIILAKSDNTHISISIVDQANKNAAPYYGLGRTVKGHKGGDVIPVTLNAGQAYLVQGNGAGPTGNYDGVIGYLDLSGTEITSDSAIGLISYHNRTDLPVNLEDNRNYLVEMLPPVSLWGKKIVTVEYDRSNAGDLMRIVASEDNTRLVVKCFDKRSRTQYNIGANTILNKGDIWEFCNNIAPRGNLTGVRGTTIITADKPVLANQYSYSGGWDGNFDFDPFMITLTPTEQFVPSTVFQTPTGFSKNFYNFIAKGYSPEDTLDERFIDPTTKKPYSPVVINNMKLGSIYFGNGDGSMNPIASLKGSRIPTTGGYATSTGDTVGGLYWGTQFTTEGVYKMESRDYLTSFGGYIYGFEDVDGYGWPAAVTFKTTGVTDKEKPKRAIKHKDDCTTWTYRYTDSTFYDIDDSTKQADMGINGIVLVFDTCAADSQQWTYNFGLIDSLGVIDSSSIAGNADSGYTFRLHVFDPSMPARAIIKVVDGNYNFSTDTVYYYPDILVVDPIDFGCNTMASLPITKNIQVRNEGEALVTVSLVKLASQMGDSTWKSGYKIATGEIPAQIGPQPIDTGASHPLTLTFAPTAVSGTAYVDTLVCVTKCDTIRIPITGCAIAPRINVEPDIELGLIKLADLTDPVCDSTVIYNRGTDTLRVTGYKGVDDIANDDSLTVADPAASLNPFTVSNMDGSALMFPFKVAPGESLAVRVCFKTTLSKSFLKYLVFLSNAYRGDTYVNDDMSQLTANTEQIDISADYINFGDRRLNSKNKGTITITNTGQSPVKVLYIKNAHNRKYMNINADGTLTLDTNFKITTDMRTILVDAQLVQSSYFATAEYATPGHPITFEVEYTPRTEESLADSLVFTFVKVDLANPGTITPATNTVATTVLAYVKGRGYLPKATISPVQAYTAPLRKDSTSSEAMNVTIADTSSSRYLSVQDINLAYDNPTYKSINFKTSPTVPTIVPKGLPLVNDVTFFGSDNGVPSLSPFTRQLTVTATVDTKDGSSLPLFTVTNNRNGVGDWQTAPNNSDTMTTISTTVNGTVYDYTRVIDVDPSVTFDLLSTNACDPVNGTFKVYNRSTWVGDTTGAGSTDIIVSDMTTWGDESVFTITDFLPTKPDTMKINAINTYHVIFTPVPKATGSYSSPIKVENDAWTGKDTIQRKNSASVMSAKLALNMDASSSTISTVLKNQKPGATIPVEIRVTNNSVIGTGSGLDSISLKLIYDLRAIKFNKDKGIKTGDIAGSWKWTGTETYIDGSDNLAQLVIDGVGSSEISQTGILAIPYFDLLLRGGQTNASIAMDSSSVNYYERSSCVSDSSAGGSVEMNSCVIDLRGILLGGTYALKALNPNPVSGAKFTVDYSVSYETPVVIELYNSIGEMVKSVVNESQVGGDYSKEVSTGDLSSGVYYLKMRAGVYTETQKVVIAK